jgi:hypothetical protein
MYLTEDQRRRLAARARAERVSEAEVVRRILDAALGLTDDVDARVAVIEETSGILADAPDWPEWLARVRGAGADHRLKDLGL